jgi:hypothetical protein
MLVIEQLNTLPKSIMVYVHRVTLIERKSDLDGRMWMQLVDDSAMILGH